MHFEGGIAENCTIEEIKKGYREEDEGYTCLICGKHFVKGEIYCLEGKLYEAVRAVQQHIVDEHQSVMHFLLEMQGSSMGISALQLQLINFFAEGLSDKEIADYLGVSGSTIRNHRFKLREKEKQSKVFLALMQLLEEKETKEESVMLQGYQSTHSLKEMVPQRERKKMLDKYFTSLGKLKMYPTYEKSKRVVLEAVAAHFSIGKKYSEQEVKQKLTEVYHDDQLLKEELLAYNYLDRSYKGNIYWARDYKHKG